MKPQQIAERVKIEADVRFGETVERLLLLLELAQEVEANTAKYLVKWSQSGLLVQVPIERRTEAAKALENKAIQLVNETPTLLFESRIQPYTPLWEAYVSREITAVAKSFIPLKDIPLCYDT